jgi:hypothetical protein
LHKVIILKAHRGRSRVEHVVPVAALRFIAKIHIHHQVFNQLGLTVSDNPDSASTLKLTKCNFHAFFLRVRVGPIREELFTD